MPAKKKVETSGFLPGLKLEKAEFKAPETPQERELRLLKDRWSFFAKDLLVWILALTLTALTWGVCLLIVTGNGWSPTEKDWARTGLMAITTGAAGILFGKQLGK
jgi:hypothetical protein